MALNRKYANLPDLVRRQRCPQGGYQELTHCVAGFGARYLRDPRLDRRQFDCSCKIPMSLILRT